ncbi:MAG: hypothetical protein KF744_09595 [Taibaiella sp.]|nr:hypothetical protein [Taibaiella sp.]
MASTLPAEFDAGIYRELHPDLRAAGFDDAGMQNHYVRHGLNEGRACSTIRNRADFLALIPAAATILEICPGLCPTLRLQNVKYYDTESRTSLVEQATQLHVQTSTIPEIDFVSETDDLGVVNEKFEALLSVHNLSRHANLISHLQQCEKLLKPGGRLFCVVPDKRYTQDHFNPETSLTTLLARYKEKDNSVHLEHRLALGTSTHYDASRHWAGRHGNPENMLETRVNAVWDGEQEVVPRHINASYFTPAGFSEILSSLRTLKLTNLVIERLYPPVYGNNEFYVVLAAG